MRERDYIDWIRENYSLRYAGNDAALIDTDGTELVITTDMLVEGTHYSSDTPARLVGRKAVAVSLSDLAAMAATPVCGVISVCFRSGCGDRVSREIMEGAMDISSGFGLDMVGGDTTSSAKISAVCVTVLGHSPEGGAPGRDGARPGHAVFVTGTLGGSILGKHLEFVPRIRESQEIVKCVSAGAMMDISDGLASDINRIMEESGVGAELDETVIPVSDAARSLAEKDGRSALEHALNDGEDFELLFTAAEEDAEKLEKLELDCGLTRIGRITERGRMLEGGYEHKW